MSEGKIIAIDGVDGSGKETQTKLLYDLLLKKYKKIKKISFPFYERDSSKLVRMYLNGEISKDADDVNAYAASLFYASDRYISYMNEWKKYVDEGYIIIMDRYVSSNMIHQSSKISIEEDKEKYLKWIYDLEYNKLELPKPDITLFLYIDFDIREKLIETRKNKINNSNEKDIHESNLDYMKRTHLNSLEIAKKQGWKIIDCMRELNGGLKEKKIITEVIYNMLINENIIQ
ncbi:MAG: dTMP kinase [bacterium]